MLILGSRFQNVAEQLSPERVYYVLWLRRLPQISVSNNSGKKVSNNNSKKVKPFFVKTLAPDAFQIANEIYKDNDFAERSS